MNYFERFKEVEYPTADDRNPIVKFVSKYALMDYRTGEGPFAPNATNYGSAYSALMAVKYYLPEEFEKWLSFYNKSIRNKQKKIFDKRKENHGMFQILNSNKYGPLQGREYLPEATVDDYFLNLISGDAKEAEEVLKVIIANRHDRMAEYGIATDIAMAFTRRNELLHYPAKLRENRLIGEDLPVTGGVYYPNYRNIPLAQIYHFCGDDGKAAEVCKTIKAFETYRDHAFYGAHDTFFSDENYEQFIVGLTAEYLELLKLIDRTGYGRAKSIIQPKLTFPMNETVFDNRTNLHEYFAMAVALHEKSKFPLELR